MSSTRKVFIFIALPLLIVFGLVAYLSLTKPTQENNPANISIEQDGTANSSGPTIRMKSLGINLESFNQSTGTAGDLTFTKSTFSSGIQLLFSDYGYVIKAENSASRQDKANPQPTFIAPLGTKVLAVVDGVVFDVPKLYSNDYSVQIYDGKNQEWVWEMEHVINVSVKKGDIVKAGQVVGEVSDYSKNGYDGQGLFEIGLLRGGNPPRHYCPFAYIEPSVKDKILSSLSSLMESWEEYRGDTTLYPETASYPVIGCRTLDPIEG